MKKCLYLSRIEEISNFLKKSKLVKNYLKGRQHADLKNNAYDVGDCQLLHTSVLNARDYDFQLFDDSLLSFFFKTSSDGLLLRYLFAPFPLDSVSYKDFLEQNDLSYREVGEGYKEFYEQYLEESPAKKNLIVMRYDYSVKEYVEKIHAVSHIHIGASQIRIASNKIIDPFTFTLFILKQMYYDKWKELVAESGFEKKLDFKDMCEAVDSKNFSDLDKKELHLI